MCSATMSQSNKIPAVASLVAGGVNNRKYYHTLFWHVALSSCVGEIAIKFQWLSNNFCVRKKLENLHNGSHSIACFVQRFKERNFKCNRCNHPQQKLQKLFLVSSQQGVSVYHFQDIEDSNIVNSHKGLEVR